MTKTALIGMQFGDEGKGKIIDYYLENENYDVVARYGGGCNAGHTQKDEKGNEIITHIIPSGIRKPDVYNLLLADVMIDPIRMVKEIKDLQEMGYTVDSSNLGISSRAHITLLYHKEFEKEWEKRKGKSAIGTTMRGIGPTAVSKYAREGIRFAEFLNCESFERFLKSLSRKHGNIVAKRVPVKRYMEIYEDARNFLKQYKVDETEVLEERKNDRWMYEGAQGVLLDIIDGTIPYVTGSRPSQPPSDTDERIGVLKAYITRVGGGPLPTRMEPKEEKMVRGVLGKIPGAEFGATTGRPRNCGWLDIVAARFAKEIARIDRIDVTKLDRLSGFPKIKVAIEYKYKSSEIKSFPADRFILENVEPVYKEFPGWTEDITYAKEPSNLPQNARDYLKRIEDMLECKTGHVSVGQSAEQTIKL